MTSGVHFCVHFTMGRFRSRQHHDGSLAAPFAGPKRFENLSAIPFWQMKVQKDQMWTVQSPVGIDSLYELYDLLAIGDDMKITVNRPVFKGFADKKNIRGVVFRQQNVSR